ncbi:Sec1-like protein [Endogone sp. FLAS-F59071]|nr:Sec1-like protein [Endogone sp. FLAS-F59071]|eukprot:RUS18043.1 Sec1-like protein [Endogone sp. FLAS-F59071]
MCGVAGFAEFAGFAGFAGSAPRLLSLLPLCQSPLLDPLPLNKKNANKHCRSPQKAAAQVPQSSRWKIVVVDSQSLKIFSAACKMSDIWEESGSPRQSSLFFEHSFQVVEFFTHSTNNHNIERLRQAYPLDAIYILTPCQDSISRFVDDFQRKAGPMYAAAHVHFTGALDNKVFEDFNRRLRVTGVSKNINTLKEIYCEFLVLESAVFALDNPYSFFTLFGPDDKNNADAEIERMAKQVCFISPYLFSFCPFIFSPSRSTPQLLSVCATLGENPMIRYHRPLDVEGAINRNIPQKLAMAVQQELDVFAKANPTFPPVRDPPLPPSTLFILDRTIDHSAPLLHEFTYQAMMNDLLEMEAGGTKYSYTYTQQDGTQATQQVTLDETDTVYLQLRHMHIAEVSDRLATLVDEFYKKNKIMDQQGSGDKDPVQTLNEMKEVLANLPQFQQEKERYSAHTTIYRECDSQFRTLKLADVANIEQNMACGVTADGDVPKTLEDDMLPLMDDPFYSQIDKIRLLMLHTITQEGSSAESERRDLLAHARLDAASKEALDNLSLLGVQLSRSANKSGDKGKKKKKPNKDEQVPYDVSRYVPIVKRVIESHINNTIQQSLFPLTRQPVTEKAGKQESGSAPAAVPQLRVYRAQWQKKGKPGEANAPKLASGPPIIIFIAGGMTYSEIRSAYELAETFNREVYIGSTHILTPTFFIEDLKQMRKPVPKPDPVIPPYTAPSTTVAPAHPLTGIKSIPGKYAPSPKAGGPVRYSGQTTRG